jgi:hypothetical protein
MEDTLLEIEGARGVFGPPSAWRDNSADENRQRWNRWDRSRLGEEWTASEPWKRALVDEVLLPTIPAGGTRVEIGPGGGGAGASCSSRAPSGSCSSMSRSGRLPHADRLRRRAITFGRDRRAGPDDIARRVLDDADPWFAESAIEPLPVPERMRG